MLMKLMHYKYRLPLMILCLLGMVFCSSCAGNKSSSKEIEIRLIQEEGKDGEVIQIPEFYSDDQEVMRKIRELEKKTNALHRIVEKEKKRGSHMEMRSYIHSVEGYPQVTVVWYVSEDTTRLYDMMTLAADEKNSEPVTCKEALEKTGLSGVDLSLKIGKLAGEAGIRGDLQTMEMQGFRLDEKGQVAQIFMKLTLKVTEGEEDNLQEHTEEHYFSWVPGEDKLESMSGGEFAVP